MKAVIRRWLRLEPLWMGQFGQDLWVSGEVFNEARNGYFVDIGAHDGIHISNTYLCFFGGHSG